MVIGGWGWWLGGPLDSRVIPNPSGFDFGLLDFGLSLTTNDERRDWFMRCAEQVG